MNSHSNSSDSIQGGDNHDYVFKFVIIGDSGVGKSCIMHHFIYNKCITIFLQLVKKETTQTIGVEFSSKIIKIGNKETKLQIWDTAGQEKFRSVARSYYRGAIGVIIVYDITKYFILYFYCLK
jgi:Ras-related protein Rab-4B